MSRADWAALGDVERAFLINAMEFDLPAGIFGDVGDVPIAELTPILLAMVARGWIDVHRYVAWTAPDGRQGNALGEVIPRAEVPAVLADPATWAYPDDPGWIGSVTLALTEAGRAVSSRTPEEMLDQ